MSDFLNDLNKLNQNFGSSKSVANKYDYENISLAKKERTSFRRKIRKIVVNVYDTAKTATKADLQTFAKSQESCLLICTKGKKSFKDLQVFDVYPNFSDCTAKEKIDLIAAHKAIIAKIANKKEVVKPIVKPIVNNAK